MEVSDVNVHVDWDAIHDAHVDFAPAPAPAHSHHDPYPCPYPYRPYAYPAFLLQTKEDRVKQGLESKKTHES